MAPRFLSDLDQIIARAKDGERDKAAELLRYFSEQVLSGRNPDTRVTAWLAFAIRTFLDDPKHDIEKALGLKRKRAGNPGGVSQKRRLTPDSHTDIAREVHTLIEGGSSARVAYRLTAQKWKVSVRQVQIDVAEHRRKVLNLLPRGDRAVNSHRLRKAVKARRI